MNRETINRTLRQVLQVNVINALIVLLRAFGVPITSEQQEAMLVFSAAIVAVVLVWNGVEDYTGRSVLKGGE